MPKIDKAKFSKGVKDKYSFKDETFLRVAKDNPKDKVEVEIGDSKQPDFKPQVKVQRWDNEVNLSFRLKDDGLEPETVDTVADKIVWKKGKREAHFYDIQNAEHPEGAYEFEVVLLEKPATNVVEFSLNTKGLDFFYQPALTPEEIEEGSSRPENVIGSYAVYASEQKTNYVGGKEYKVGKVGHIYRPQVEDANGNKVWGELNIDTDNRVLSVTIPQDFLDNAVYPVRHAAGLTFGYTTQGASGTAGIDNNIRGTYFTTTEVGDVTSITASLTSNVDSTPRNVKTAIYAATSTTDVGALLAQSEERSITINNGVNSWETFTITYTVSASTNYFLVAWSFNANGGYFLRHDTTGDSISTSLTYGSWPDPMTGETTPTTRKHSIYATYTASGGGGNAKLINIDNTWKSVNTMLIQIDGVWKPVTKALINIGNVWKTIF